MVSVIYLMKKSDLPYDDVVNDILESIPCKVNHLKLYTHGRLSAEEYYELYPYDCVLGVRGYECTKYYNLYNIDKDIALKMRKYIMEHCHRSYFDIPVVQTFQELGEMLFYTIYTTCIARGMRMTQALIQADYKQHAVKLERVKTGKIVIPERMKWFK